jgi:hypothetical protein
MVVAHYDTNQNKENIKLQFSHQQRFKVLDFADQILY